MTRCCWLAITLAVLTCIDAASATAPLVLTISIYAPEQKASPVHIVGFRYKDDAIEIVLDNRSSKTVVGVHIVGTESAPSGCSPQVTQLPGETGGDGAGQVKIPPHRTAVTLPINSPFSPPSLVRAARDLQTAYLQIQAGLVKVDFEDGSTWSPDTVIPTTPFDPSLVEAEAGTCSNTNVLAVVDALAKVTKVGFEAQVARAENPLANPKVKDKVPSLVFRCSLNDNLAMCPSAE